MSTGIAIEIVDLQLQTLGAAYIWLQIRTEKNSKREVEQRKASLGNIKAEMRQGARARAHREANIGEARGVAVSQGELLASGDELHWDPWPQRGRRRSTERERGSAAGGWGASGRVYEVGKMRRSWGRHAGGGVGGVRRRTGCRQRLDQELRRVLRTEGGARGREEWRRLSLS
jgi:hypothetical protein